MRVDIGHVMLGVHHHLLLHHSHGGGRILHGHPLVLVLMRLGPLLLPLLLSLLLTQIAVAAGLSHQYLLPPTYMLTFFPFALFFFPPRSRRERYDLVQAGAEMPRPGDKERKRKKKRRPKFVGLLFYIGTPHPHTLNATTLQPKCGST